MTRIGGFSEGDAIRIGQVVRYVEKGGIEHPFHRARWPVSDPSEFALPTGDCDCCPGCVCYPADDDDVTDDCGAIGCLLKNYKIVSQELPFGGTRDLAWDTGCVFESDAFDVEICEEDYGSHFWRLTVASGCCATTLELINNGGTDVPLKYTNIRPFRMLCATEFAFEENCDLYATDELKSIAHTWPAKLCVNPVGDDSCVPCPPVPTVVVTCCANPIPTIMTATIDGCPSFPSSVEIELDPAVSGPATWMWESEEFICSMGGNNCTYTVQLICTGGTTWTLQLAGGAGPTDCSGCVQDSSTPDTVQCDPFYVQTIANRVSAGRCDCCTDPITITVGPIT